MQLKQEILQILAAEPNIDRPSITEKCHSASTEKKVADQLYLMKKAGEIIGEKARGTGGRVVFLYRLPGEMAVADDDDLEQDADEGQQESAVREHEELKHGPRVDPEPEPSVEALDRQSFDQVDKATVPDADGEAPTPIRIGYFNDETMVIYSDDTEWCAINKDSWRELVRFGRAVGWKE